MSDNGTCGECYGHGQITVINYQTREEHEETCGSCGGSGRES